jgi:hypothetical protein
MLLGLQRRSLAVSATVRSSSRGVSGSALGAVDGLAGFFGLGRTTASLWSGSVSTLQEWWVFIPEGWTLPATDLYPPSVGEPLMTSQRDRKNP